MLNRVRGLILGTVIPPGGHALLEPQALLVDVAQPRLSHMVGRHGLAVLDVPGHDVGGSSGLLT